MPQPTVASIVSFEDADAKHRLSRYSEYPHNPETVALFAGDLDLGSHASGKDVVARFGITNLKDRIPFLVVTGDLTVGVLDLDEDVSQSFGLLVMGKLRATAIRLDFTMLFVFGGADVSGGIFFETNDGTLSIAGTTTCPLVVVHEGDFNVKVEGWLFDSYNEGPLEKDDDADEDDDDADEDDDDADEDDDDDDVDWPFQMPNMMCEEAIPILRDECWTNDPDYDSLQFDSERAFALISAGESVFRDGSR